MKTQDYLNFNGKIVRHEGSTFKIIAVKLGKNVLVDADCVVGPMKDQKINLITSRSPLSKDLRAAINMNLVS